MKQLKKKCKNFKKVPMIQNSLVCMPTSVLGVSSISIKCKGNGMEKIVSKVFFVFWRS